MTFKLLEACSYLDGAKGAINFCPDFIAVVSKFASTTDTAESCHPWEEMAVSGSGTAESWKAIYVCPMCSSSDSHHLPWPTRSWHSSSQVGFPGGKGSVVMLLPTACHGIVFWMAAKAAQILVLYVSFFFQENKMTPFKNP